ncbi:MAG: stalk domain-containing protein [Conexivisphaerales archaeon]
MRKLLFIAIAFSLLFNLVPNSVPIFASSVSYELIQTFSPALFEPDGSHNYPFTFVNSKGDVFAVGFYADLEEESKMRDILMIESPMYNMANSLKIGELSDYYIYDRFFLVKIDLQSGKMEKIYTIGTNSNKKTFFNFPQQIVKRFGDYLFVQGTIIKNNSFEPSLLIFDLEKEEIVFKGNPFRDLATPYINHLGIFPQEDGYIVSTCLNSFDFISLMPPSTVYIRKYDYSGKLIWESVLQESSYWTGIVPYPIGEKDGNILFALETYKFVNSERKEFIKMVLVSSNTGKVVKEGRLFSAKEVASSEPSVPSSEYKDLIFFIPSLTREGYYELLGHDKFMEYGFSIYQYLLFTDDDLNVHKWFYFPMTKGFFNFMKTTAPIIYKFEDYYVYVEISPYMKPGVHRIAVFKDGNLVWERDIQDAYKTRIMTWSGMQDTLAHLLLTYAFNGRYYAYMTSEGKLVVLDLTDGSTAFEIDAKDEERRYAEVIAFTDDFIAVAYFKYCSIAVLYCLQEDSAVRVYKKVNYYTVSFDTGSEVVKKEVKEGSLVEKIEDPKQEYYVFSGWYKDKDFKEPFDFETPIREDIILYAKWTPKSYTIKASAYNGGSITPSGEVQVLYGGSQTFTITPNRGYAISLVSVDGKSIGPVSTYTFSNVNSSHTIEVVFEKLTTQIVLQIGSSTFTVNGSLMELDSPPIIKNGRTLLPIRAVVEALGGEVLWDGAQKKVTVSLGNNTIELWIGKPGALVNGLDAPIDSTNPKVVPEIINGRTMLPLRFVAENLGCSVEWDGTTKTITITYQGG